MLLEAANFEPYSIFRTDYLGEDVWSRFLWGGRSVFALTTLATTLGVGLATGLVLAPARLTGGLTTLLFVLSKNMWRPTQEQDFKQV